MLYYGISMIHLDPTGAEVDEVQLHEILKRSPGTDEIGKNDSRRVAYREVANLLNRGDFVWVLVDDGPDSFMHTDMVGLKPPDNQRIGSFDTNSDPTHSLYELPQF